MFAFNLLVYTGSISMQPTRKGGAKAAIGFAILVELTIKLGTIVEATRFFVEMARHLVESTL